MFRIPLHSSLRQRFSFRLTDPRFYVFRFRLYGLLYYLSWQIEYLGEVYRTCTEIIFVM